ncbi:MarR family transcriptional regulator [Intrasporangium oryzae NRRL B-24470]|uniref:MarR family transcriptional regulator n=1 Tax=Intrasporangium oryzae NRRL B-24470 TaxID=1386089 RepID=W9GER4_9MICO|nr:MarR family transcriptional regulator [Intrasporangium oryzae]EWT02369.1 MarR family transcriptional regulator [Intrasporangium oryzae NRRL B-24470]
MPPTDEPAPDDAGAPLDELLLGAARALRRRWSTGLDPLDLSPHDARALRVIGHHGPTRLGVVAEHLRIAPRSATDVVDRLERRGLVERAPDPGDRRATTVRLTSAGETVLGEVDAARRVGAEEFFGRLSDRERRTLATVLARLDPGRLP